MQLSIEKLDSGVKQLTLVGRLDLKGTNEIDNQFTFQTSSASTPILVDMSGVDFIASIGMRLLISNAKALARRGSKLVLLAPTPLVREALTTSGFADLIPMIDDREEAIKSLKSFIPN
jgi:anti-sigma B factor antagonist